MQECAELEALDGSRIPEPDAANEVPLGADTEALDRLRRLLDIPDRPVKKPAEMAVALALLAWSLLAFMFENPYEFSTTVQKALSTGAAGIGLAAFAIGAQRRRSHKYTGLARLLAFGAMALSVYALLVHLTA